MESLLEIFSGSLSAVVYWGLTLAVWVGVLWAFEAATALVIISVVSVVGLWALERYFGTAFRPLLAHLILAVASPVLTTKSVSTATAIGFAAAWTGLLLLAVYVGRRGRSGRGHKHAIIWLHIVAGLVTVGLSTRRSYGQHSQAHPPEGARRAGLAGGL